MNSIWASSRNSIFARESRKLALDSRRCPCPHADSPRPFCALKPCESIADPAGGGPVRPGEFVVLEMPLGRAYAATAELIDILVWVNTPLDVALARNIRAMAAEAAPAGDAQDFLRWLDAYLGQYPDQLRTILQLQEIRVAAAADIVLDGLQAPENLVAEVLRAIAIRRAPN